MRINRRSFFLSSLAASATLGKSATAETKSSLSKISTRADWVHWLQRVAEPVLTHMANGTLQQAMPVEAVAGHEKDRAPGTHLEAVGRLLSGIGPWLELEDPAMSVAEKQLQQRYRKLAVEGLARGLDPSSPNYLRFGATGQTLVDAAFLSLGLLRAPKQLLAKVNADHLFTALVAERKIKPGNNNWVLFSAMNEACIFTMGKEWRREPVEYALQKHQEWYVGDGMYGDGPHFHWDYYNSFVIQPFMLQVLETFATALPEWKALAEKERARARRYAAIQEKLIAPDGSYPAIGRSITYRCGAFQLLADATHRSLLPEELPANQVRCALSAVIERTLSPAGTFNKDGWLQIGLAGHQPSLGEVYISTGSLYLCAEAFIPLGLPASHVFWSGPNVPWTSQIIWSGKDHKLDHAQD